VQAAGFGLVPYMVSAANGKTPVGVAWSPSRRTSTRWPEPVSARQAGNTGFQAEDWLARRNVWKLAR